MAYTKSRSSEGCWTCRLRRKKCDEAHPLCANCVALEIDCLYSDTKPAWMDGAELQKERAEQLKAEIKRNASWRREKRYFHGLESGIEDLSIVQSIDENPPAQHDGGGSSGISSGVRPPGGQPFPTSSSPHKSAAGVEDALTCGSTTDSSCVTDPAASTASNATSPSSVDGQLPSAQPSVSSGLATDGTLAGAAKTLTLENERELHSVMMYLDYVFPFLFPFYRPPLVHAGRGWLLVMLMRNKSLLHSALSLSSFMYSIVLDTTFTGHNECKERNWSDLQDRVEMGLRELQNEMCEINSRGVAGNLYESALVMESIIQMLCFEATIAQPESNWQIHLDAALILFEQIIEHHGHMYADPNSPINWKYIMYQLPCLQPLPAFDGAPLTSDQCAMEFFTAVLLHIDIVTSTVLGCAPRLHKYHRQLLVYNPSSDTDGPPSTWRIRPVIRLENYTGIHNWVMLAIGDIAALDVWKKECRRTGQLSMVQLVSRAREIETDLNTQIALLDNDVNTCASHAAATAAADSGPDRIPNRVPSAHAQAFSEDALPTSFGGSQSSQPFWATRIWAQAALTYLCIVVSGWQPASEEMHASVMRTMELLRTGVPNPAALRSVAWPLCVVGCMACPSYEPEIRSMIGAVGNLEVYGTLRQALHAMEYNWANRATTIDSDNWDLTCCFRGTLTTPFFM